MDTATEIKNQKILLASLRKDIIEASTGLSVLVNQKKTTKKEISAAQDELAACKLEVHKGNLARQELRDMAKTAATDIHRARKEVEVLVVQKKDFLKELKRLNEWVYTAQGEAQSLDVKIGSLEADSVLKKQYIEDIKMFEDKVEAGREAYREVLLEAKLEKDSAETATSLSEMAVKKAEAKLEKLKQAAKMEKQKLDSFVKERNQKENDLKIYADRTEKAHRKQFPGKTFKI